jgi:hypothetical protein
MIPDTMNEKHWEQLKVRLARSPFRSRFKLKEKDFYYLQARGREVILQHALDFIRQRLAPAFPVKDGKQTPMKGHPVFIAQHATATCCRNCLQKWHGIHSGKILEEHEIEYISQVIHSWIQNQTTRI